MKNKIFLLAGPIAAILFFVQTPEWINKETWYFLGITLWILIWWITEIVPIGITSLLPIVLFPLFGVMGEKTVTSHYTKPVIFLFMGGFFIAASLTKWNLHKRFAYFVINIFGNSSNGLIIGFMLATACLSMWISNTATSIMMATIGLSVIQTLFDRELCSDKQAYTFAKAVLLAIAYSASVGGITTLIGTPPNLLFAGFVEENLNQNVSMLAWVKMALPLVITLMFFTWLVIYLLFPSIKEIPVNEIRIKMRSERGSFEKLKTPEWSVIIVFFMTAIFWILRVPISNYFKIKLSDTIIAIAASLILFCIPLSIKKKSFLLDWETARQIPWGILLMFGAGLSLATGFNETGLDIIVGDMLSSLAEVPNRLIILTIVTFSIFLTELISNTAATATLLPLMLVVSSTLNVPFFHLAVPVTMVCSAAFMLPIATPPNAVVFSFKYLKVSEMAKVGLILNIIAIGIILLFSSINII